MVRCRNIETEECASPRAWRFLQNCSEELVIREIERKDFFLQRTVIFISYHIDIIIPQTLPLSVRRRLRLPVSKKGTFLQFNELNCTIQPRRKRTRNTPTNNRGVSEKFQ